MQCGCLGLSRHNNQLFNLTLCCTKHGGKSIVLYSTPYPSTLVVLVALSSQYITLGGSTGHGASAVHILELLHELVPSI